jgi:DNA-binding winged helix-turn-helix (wHTH) protein
LNDLPQQGRVIEFGPFRFDRDLGKLTKHGVCIRLRGMPLKILQHLVEQQGGVVTRIELQRLLWNGAAFGDFEHGLNTAMNVVRRTLGDSAERAHFIETVQGSGYRFVAPIRAATASVDTAGARRASALNPAPVNYTGIRNGADGQSEGSAKTALLKSRWAVAADRAVAAFGLGSRRTKNKAELICGSTPSAISEANDQYNLAMNFLVFQNDLSAARKSFERALAIDPEFASARLQRVLSIIIEIYNGYANDESLLLDAEEDLHIAESAVPASDGLFLAAHTAVYLAQGRLDRVPAAKLQDWWRRGGDNGAAPPVWAVIVRMLQGEIEEPLAIVRERLESNPLENPTRMLLGELLRTSGDTSGAIQVLERVFQQGTRHIAAAWFLTMAYLDGGKREQAWALLQDLRPEFQQNYMWRHAVAICPRRPRQDRSSTRGDG